MSADLEQWKHCLIKSIQLFCRNFCQYDQEAKIDGLLAITLDKKEVILVKLQEVDNDASSQTAVNGTPTDQSELLESILRFLAPSCRLLKKTAIAPSLPSVWQPVGDRCSAEAPDRITFLRSLGLAPTALVSSRKVETSHASRLRTRSSRRAMHSIPAFYPLPSPKMLERSSQEAHSEPPTLSPCPSRVVLSVSKSECSEPSDENVPLPTLRRCLSDDDKNEPVVKEHIRITDPLTVDCNKAPAGLKCVSSHMRLLNSKPESLLQMANNAISIGSDNTSCAGNTVRGKLENSKNSHSSTAKDTDSQCEDADEKKPVNRVKKRNSGSSGSSGVSPAVSQSKSSNSVHGAAVKRVKVEASGKSENSTSSVRTKADASQSNKKLVKSKVNTGNCKIKTVSNSGSAGSRSVKAAASVCSKKTPVKSSVGSRKNVKNARQKLLNKTKARLKVLYSKKASSRREQVLKALHKARTAGCGKCKACLVKEDCRTCKFCLDMKRYGGANKLRKKCRLRQCRVIKKQQKLKAHSNRAKTTSAE